MPKELNVTLMDTNWEVKILQIRRKKKLIYGFPLSPILP